MDFESARYMKGEDAEQIAVMDWIRLMNLDNIVMHIANQRATSPMQGAKLKRMGVKSGVSDLFIVRSSGHWKGLWLELKSKTGKVSPKQLQFLADMKAEGYDTAICFGADNAIDYIKKYLSGSSKIIYHQPPNCS
jgi:hypothetical protein